MHEFSENFQVLPPNSPKWEGKALRLTEQTLIPHDLFGANVPGIQDLNLKRIEMRIF